MHRDYKFEVEQEVRMFSYEEMKTMKGIVVDKTANTVMIQWDEKDDYVEYSRGDYFWSDIKLNRKRKK